MVTTTSAAGRSRRPMVEDVSADVDPLSAMAACGLVNLMRVRIHGEHVNFVAGEVTHPPGGHLGASGVVDTEEEDTGV